LDTFRLQLDENKIARDDVWEYTTKLLQRQQLINEKLIDRGIWENAYWMNILDACCWPEWSSLAVLKRWWNRRWNEISLKTFEHLKDLWLNVKNGKVEALPFDNETFDYIVYCYAINNIQATSRVFSESKRVLKYWWDILVADPWITHWISLLTLYWICNWWNIHVWNKHEWLVEKFGSYRKIKNIESYFALKNVNISEYVSVILSWLCWLTIDSIIYDLDHFTDLVHEKYPNQPIGSLAIDRILYCFHAYIIALYWQNIILNWKNQWFEVYKFCVSSCHVYNGDQKNLWKLWWLVDIKHSIDDTTNIKSIVDFLFHLQIIRSDALYIWIKWIKKNLLNIFLKFKKL
jgi:ubiquinone/menaquinone biosynthesis C-methylase UbiE